MKRITKIVAVSAILSALFLTGCSKSKSALLNEYLETCQGVGISGETEAEKKANIASSVKKICAKLEAKNLSAEEEAFLDEAFKLIDMGEGEEKDAKVAELKEKLSKF